MSNNKKELPKEPVINTEIFKLRAAYFNHDIPIYLNYVNKVVAGQYTLTIKGNFLFIYDETKEYTMLVPLTSVASADLLS